MGFSGVVSVISLSGCSRFALSLFVWALLSHLGFYLFMVSLLVVSLIQQVYLYSQLTPILICDQ